VRKTEVTDVMEAEAELVSVADGFARNDLFVRRRTLHNPHCEEAWLHRLQTASEPKPLVEALAEAEIWFGLLPVALLLLNGRIPIPRYFRMEPSRD
jgi:hypothetical protein